MKPRRKEGWEPLVSIDGVRVKALIEHMGISIAEAARRAQVRYQTLDFIVKGRSQRARVDQRARLARVLRVSHRWIGGEKTDAPPLLAVLMESEGGPSFYRINRPELESLPVRSQLEVAGIVRLLSGLTGNEGVDRAVVQYIVPLLDIGRWRASMGAAVSNEREAEAFSVAVGEAVRVLVQPWERAGSGPDGVRAKALRNVAGVLIGTMDALQASANHSMFAWRARLALMEQVSQLYEQICALSLPATDSWRSWSTRVGPIQKRIRDLQRRVQYLRVPAIRQGRLSARPTNRTRQRRPDPKRLRLGVRVTGKGRVYKASDPLPLADLRNVLTAKRGPGRRQFDELLSAELERRDGEPRAEALRLFLGTEERRAGGARLEVVAELTAALKNLGA